MRLGVLERVAILLGANLRELLAEADDPQAVVKDVILDIQNQLLQIKSRMAVALADQVRLESKVAESEKEAAEWMRKAEAVASESTARAGERTDSMRRALERAVICRRL